MSAEPRWHWRNCRSIGFSVSFWLWPWMLGAGREDDVYGGEMYVGIGPFGLSLSYSCGNCSSTGLERYTGLSLEEAHERALKYEGRPTP